MKFPLNFGEIPEGVFRELQSRFDVVDVDLSSPVNKKTKSYKLRYHHPIDGNDEYEQSYMVRLNHHTERKNVTVRQIIETGLVRIK